MKLFCTACRDVVLEAKTFEGKDYCEECYDELAHGIVVPHKAPEVGAWSGPWDEDDDPMLHNIIRALEDGG